MILAIDPGNEQSAWILYDRQNKMPVKFGKEPNDIVLEVLKKNKDKTNELAIEMIASYGMAVGQSVFETCVWVGRFIQLWTEINQKNKIKKIYRKDVKIHICQTMKAKDSNIRQAIMDRYGSTREIAIGKKNNPGPLYGISNDVWAALGVAITYCEANLEESEQTSKQKIENIKTILKKH